MKNAILIRKATLKDLPRIMQLWNVLMEYHIRHHGFGRGIYELVPNTDNVSAKYLKKEICRRNTAIFVAEMDGKIVGYVQAQLQKRVPLFVQKKNVYVGGISVDPRYRKRGVGAELLEEAEEWAKKRGAYSMDLMVNMDNKGARTVYSKAGFKERDLKMEKIVK